jgi:hypothetical protein
VRYNVDGNVEPNLWRREAVLFRRLGADILDGGGGGGGEADPGAATVHPDGAGPRTTRLDPGLPGPTIAGAGAAARSAGAGSVAILWVSDGSTTTGLAEDEARSGSGRWPPAAWMRGRCSATSQWTSAVTSSPNSASTASDECPCLMRWTSAPV